MSMQSNLMLIETVLGLKYLEINIVTEKSYVPTPCQRFTLESFERNKSYSNQSQSKHLRDFTCNV